MRRLEVRLQRNRWVQTFLRKTVSGYLRFVAWSSRWTYLGLDPYTHRDGAPAVIMCCWHGRLAGTPFIGNRTGRPMKALASDHPDGMLIVDMLKGMGYESILLSTSGDNTQSLREAVRALRKGTSLGISTDGPMGPAYKSKPGAVTMAGLSGAAMVPMAFAARPAIRLGTWDGFVLPLPFGRCVLSTGDPITAPRRLNSAEEIALLSRLDAAIDAEVVRCEQQLRRQKTSP